MNTWKTKLYGDNTFNFYLWNLVGLVMIGASAGFALLAILLSGTLRSPTVLVLLAIYSVLLGHFALALQNYHARVVKTIETETQKKEDDGIEV